MFETVAPPEGRPESRSALYEALVFSLFLHAAGGIGAVASNLWDVKFPVDAPSYLVAFSVAAPDPPPPPPPAPKPQSVKPDTIAPKVAAIPPDAFTPVAIPDTIPVVKQEAFTPSLIGPNAVVADGEEAGVRGGVTGGLPGGVVGGTEGSVVVPDDGRVHISRDKRLPLSPMSQDFPFYPFRAQTHGWEDELVVRYVIGKDGRVKEVSVVEAPAHDIFIEGTLSAIRTWRFRPLIKDGKPQEVVHELTVYYRLNAHSS